MCLERPLFDSARSEILEAGSAAMDPKPKDYEAFWPYYVSRHMKPATRRLHFVGTALVLASVLAGVLVSPLWLAAAPFAGYGPAWAGHFFVERNRPATFTYPLWSLRADFRMFRLMLMRRMAPEVERAALRDGTGQPAAS